LNSRKESQFAFMEVTGRVARTLLELREAPEAPEARSRPA